MTSLSRRLHSRLSDPDRQGSLSSRCRTVRFRELLRSFPALDTMRVLDLGGTPDFWRSAPVRPAHVTTVNLTAYVVDEPWLRHVVGDACVPSTVDVRSARYDLVVSNSLIEHVGGYRRRRELAAVVRSAAPAHWVQTPNRYFPVEPHYVAPGFQFLPVRTRARLVSRWPLAHERVYTEAEALAQVLTIDLVSATEMRHLFPESTIWHERILGLSKSLVAVRRG